MIIHTSRTDSVSDNGYTKLIMTITPIQNTVYKYYIDKNVYPCTLRANKIEVINNKFITVH